MWIREIEPDIRSCVVHYCLSDDLCIGMSIGYVVCDSAEAHKDYACAVYHIVCFVVLLLSCPARPQTSRIFQPEVTRRKEMLKIRVIFQF